TAEADRLPLDDIARQVQPGLNVSGSVSGSAQIGSGANTPLETHGMLTLTSGAIGYPPLTGAESFAHSGGELSFNLDPARGEAAFEIGLPSAARLDGAVSIRDPLNADLSAQAVQGSLTARLPDVSAYHRWWPAVRELRGALDAELSLGGSRAQPEFVAAVSLTDAALGSEGVGWAGDASAEAWLRRSADDEWSGSIQLSAPRGHITYPKTDDAGDLEYRDLVASAELASQTLDAEIRGGFRDGGVFNGRLAVSSVGAAAERSALDGQLSMHLPNLRLFQSLLPEYGPDPGTLDVNLDIGGNRAQPEITATAALTDAGLGTQVVGWAGDISASGSMHRSPGGQWSGSIQLSAPRGRITSPKTDNVDDLEYRDLLVNAELANQDLDVQLRGEFAADGAVAGRLAVSAVGATAHRSALDGELSIHFPNLRLLQSLLPEYGPDQGTLDVDLIIGGSRAQPAVTGSAMVADAQFTLPKLGITLADVNASLQGAGGDRLTLDGIARSGAGKVSARGDLSLRDGSAWRADVIVQGENVTVMDQPEAHVLASPDLRLVLRPTSIKVDGTVLIPEAEVRPAAQQAVGVVVSRDVVLVETDTDRPQTAPMTVHANIDVRLGDRVSFDGFGISGKLTGALSVNDQPGKATTATGELQIGDGQYVVYGQSIPIQTGRLVFAGGVIDNPGLDARAERKVRNVTAGARVRGTAAAPELVLYSEPDLPDADKLSYLILGRSTSEASGAEGAILFSAATSLLPQGGGQIRETLRNTFGLDELSVQGADENGEGSSLVLGKYLAPRLYVSYAAGLAEAINVFRIRYELSKRWTVQTESSQRESGGDLLYTIER
ncbi:MAG: translocation/assembly module TamB domain-containing protein, partial [Gammaproteobacteria bacterium]|nr:translocation/assembly module TamB domain-containing protein [Gammaproteobacteria bacterium]